MTVDDLIAMLEPYRGKGLPVVVPGTGLSEGACMDVTRADLLTQVIRPNRDYGRYGDPDDWRGEGLPEVEVVYIH